MESNCTLRFGFKALIKSILYTKQSFVSAFLKHFEMFWQVLRDRPVHVLVVFGNGRGLLFVSFYTIM